MKENTIYFFSGSGNSFATARSLARELGGAELINMAGLFDKEEVVLNSKRVGFVFPVYGSMPPKPVRAWFSRLKFDRETTFYAVCTCGMAPGHSLLKVNKILNESGGKLSWGFHILQPQAGIGSKKINTPALNEKRYSLQEQRIQAIARHILNEDAPVIDKSGRLSEFFNGSTLKVLPTISKLIWHLITKGMKNMSFHPDDNCNGCGICERLCPAGNIKMDNGRPLWGDNCLGCMGCYHWCPPDAVKNVDLDMIQSPHRDVTVRDLLEYSPNPH